MLSQSNMRKQNSIDLRIEEVLVALETMSPETDAYTTAVCNLERLLDARCKRRLKMPSPDTIAHIVANSAWILLILKYEESDSILSKAFGFILKGRV